jgi:hypothetical protein
MGDSVNPFAALLADVEQRLDIDQTIEYLAFPKFAIRLGLLDLVFDADALGAAAGLDAGKAAVEAQLNQEDFAVLVNAIPEPGSAFACDGPMLWSTYQRVVESAGLPDATAGDDEALQTATFFGQCRENLMLARRPSLRGDGAEFFSTGFIPAVDMRDPNAWTAITLDRDAMQRLAPQLSAAVQEWLVQRNVGGDLDGSIRVTHLACEVLPISVSRPWLRAEVFTNRCWRWNDQPLSDGSNPPKGLLPAYVTRLVLARKFELTVELTDPAASSTAATVILRGFDRSSRVMVPMKVLVRRHPNNGSGQPLDTDDLGNSGARFAAPVRFRVEPAIAQLRDTIQQAEAALQAKQGEAAEAEAATAKHAGRVADLEKRLRGFRPGVDRVVRKLPGKPPRTIITDVRRMRQRFKELSRTLEQNQAAVAAFRAAFTEQGAGIAQLQAGVTALEALGQASADADDVFVLAALCRRLPKCPDTDERLFVTPQVEGGN